MHHIGAKRPIHLVNFSFVLTSEQNSPYSSLVINSPVASRPCLMPAAQSPKRDWIRGKFPYAKCLQTARIGFGQDRALKCRGRKITDKLSACCALWTNVMLNNFVAFHFVINHSEIQISTRKVSIKIVETPLEN